MLLNDRKKRGFEYRDFPAMNDPTPEPLEHVLVRRPGGFWDENKQQLVEEPPA